MLPLPVTIILCLSSIAIGPRPTLGDVLRDEMRGVLRRTIQDHDAFFEAMHSRSGLGPVPVPVSTRAKMADSVTPVQLSMEDYMVAYAAYDAMKKGPPDLSDLPPKPIWRSPSHLTAMNGYPFEEYDVRTKDGYILRLHRIPRQGRKAVFIGSALLTSSAAYMLLGKNSLAMKLHDRGYDVWLGNFRGNGESFRHDNLTTQDADFWDFSFQEHGAYDIPAFIDTILEKTQQPQLTYIGYSMSCVAFYIMASERPEYNARVNAVFLLAPPVFMQHQTSPLLTMMHSYENDTETLQEITGRTRMYNVLPLLRMFEHRACPVLVNTTMSCERRFESLGGRGHLLVIPEVEHYYPLDASVKECLHFVQLANPYWEGFRKFNYGAEKNRRTYGRDTPPDYDLSQVTAPVYHYYGSTDTLAPADQKDDFDKRVKTIKRHYVTPQRGFGHTDFMLGESAFELYNEMLADVDRHHHK